MDTLFAFVPVLGCAAMMLACFAMMRGGHRSTTTTADHQDATHDATTEQARIGAGISNDG